MFGKKTAADVLKLFELLSDEEKAKVLEGLKQPDSTNEEEAAEPDEHIAEQDGENGAAEQPPQDIDGNMGEQRQNEGSEENNADDEADSTAPETPESAEADEPAADPAAAEVDYGEVTQALAARISSLEEKFSALEQKLADDVAKDNDQDFGSSPSLPTHDDGNSRMAEVMNNYAGANARKYY